MTSKEERIQLTYEKYLRYRKAASKCRCIYYWLGGTVVGLSVIVSSLSAVNGVSGDAIPLIAFFLSTLITFASVILNFLKIETKIFQFHQTSKDFQELKFDLENDAISEDTYLERCRNLDHSALPVNDCLNIDSDR